MASCVKGDLNFFTQLEIMWRHRHLPDEHSTEYVEEHLKALFEMEQKRVWPVCGYLDHPDAGMTWKLRAKYVDHVYRWCMNFGFGYETFFTTLLLFDILRSHCAETVKSVPNLVVLHSCLQLASKVHEKRALEVDEVVNSLLGSSGTSDTLKSKKQELREGVKRLERKLFALLQFDVFFPTPIDFFHLRLLQEEPLQKQTEWVKSVEIVLEIAVYDGAVVGYKPSAICLAAQMLVCQIYDKDENMPPVREDESDTVKKLCERLREVLPQAFQWDALAKRYQLRNTATVKSSGSV